MAFAFDINKKYNFTTLAPAVLGGNHTLMKVLSIMTAEQAIKYRDIYTMHAQLAPFIVGLPLKANDATYILFETVDKVKTLLAIEWLNASSIAEVTSVNARVDLRNIDSGELSLIRNYFLELGYTDFDITTF